MYRGNTITVKPVVFILAQRVRNRIGRRQISWLFTKVAEDLNSGLP